MRNEDDVGGEQGQRDMSSECCVEVEQRLGYEDMEVGWL